MTKTNSSFERLLTVSLPETKHADLLIYAKRHGFANFSALIRHALENFDARQSLEAPETSRQVSFRIPDRLRNSLDKQAKKAGVSLGHLIRSALDTLPEKSAAPKTTPKKTARRTAPSPKKAASPKPPAKKGRK